MNKKPIEITGLMLRTAGNEIIVEIEYSGCWYEVMREINFGPKETVISHIVETLGMFIKIQEQMGSSEQ